MTSKDARFSSPQKRGKFRRRRQLYFVRAMGRPQPGAAAPVDLLALEQKSRESGEENQQLREALARQRAEFDNYRRRMLKEKDQVRESAREDLISRLLPVVDNFERALDSAAQVPEAEPIRKGIEMVAAQLLGILEADGLQRIQALDAEFDPNLHEAISVEARDDVADNHVVQVLLSGWRLGERVIRPAMVKVAKAPPAKKEQD